MQKISRENAIFGIIIAVIVITGTLLAPINAVPTIGDIPPTRAFQKIFTALGNVTANKYNANLNLTGDGITITPFFANNTLRFSVADSSNGNVTGGANIGAGTGLVFKNQTNGTLNFRSLLQGTGITITTNANDVTISNSGSSGFTEINNLTPGDGYILATNSSGHADVKTLTAGTGVSITNGSKTITISATGTAGFTEMNSYPGGSARILRSNSSNEAVFKSVTSGSGISVSNGTDTLTISCTGCGTGESTTGSNLGTSGQGVFSALVGFDLQFKRLISSTLSITSNSTNVIIDTISSGFTKINSLNDGTASIVATNSSNQATFKTLTQGTGISITNGSKTLTIASTITQGITKANNLDGGTASVFATNSSTQVTAKTLTAGTGISITNGSKTLTIATSGGITSLAANVTATTSVSVDTLVWTIPLTANSGNTIDGVITATSATSGNAVRLAANVTNLNTRGYCMVTQVSTTTANSIDNIVMNTVSTGRATNTGETAWIAAAQEGLPIAFTCSVKTGPTAGNLKIWITPEVASSNIQAKAGSYYIKAP